MRELEWIERPSSNTGQYPVDTNWRLIISAFLTCGNHGNKVLFNLHITLLAIDAFFRVG